MKNIDARINWDQKQKLIDLYKQYGSEAFTCNDDPQHMEFASYVKDICGITFSNYNQIDYLISRIKLWDNPVVQFANSRSVNQLVY